MLFVEDVIPATHKKYIRFFDVNKPTKKNLMESKALPLPDKFDRTHKYLDSVQFSFDGLPNRPAPSMPSANRASRPLCHS